LLFRAFDSGPSDGAARDDHSDHDKYNTAMVATAFPFFSRGLSPNSNPSAAAGQSPPTPARPSSTSGPPPPLHPHTCVPLSLTPPSHPQPIHFLFPSISSVTLPRRPAVMPEAAPPLLHRPHSYPMAPPLLRQPFLTSTSSCLLPSLHRRPQPV
jgi:hypothetical protein